MRATRALLRGDTHPTLAEPGPLDACGWCHDWILEGNDPALIAMPLAGAEPLGEGFFSVAVEGHAVMALTPPGEGGSGTPELGIAVICSEECGTALREALARDEARANCEDVPRPEPTDAERLEAKPCSRSIARGGPIGADVP